MRAALGPLRWVLAGLILLAVAEQAVARPPIVVFSPYYAPYARVIVLGGWPYAWAPMVPLLPRVYDYRGLDPWGPRLGTVYGPTYGGAYRFAPRETAPPQVQTPPPGGVVPEVIPAPQPNGGGPREF